VRTAQLPGVRVEGAGVSENEEFIKLDQFLKLAQVAMTGGEAKAMILSGMIKVNGEVETRRGRKLRHGDRVWVEGEELVVQVE
jgi:ribosome-associated protein